MFSILSYWNQTSELEFQKHALTKQKKIQLLIYLWLRARIFVILPMYPNTQNTVSVQFTSVLSLNHVWLFATPWIAARQASLSITNSQSLLKLRSIESVIPSNSLILCHPLLPTSIFPSIRVFSNESVLHIRCQSTGVSASASVLPMNIEDWFPLGWTGWISLQSKGLSRVFSNTTVKKH